MFVLQKSSQFSFSASAKMGKVACFLASFGVMVGKLPSFLFIVLSFVSWIRSSYCGWKLLYNWVSPPLTLGSWASIGVSGLPPPPDFPISYCCVTITQAMWRNNGNHQSHYQETFKKFTQPLGLISNFEFYSGSIAFCSLMAEKKWISYLHKRKLCLNKWISYLYKWISCLHKWMSCLNKWILHL